MKANKKTIIALFTLFLLIVVFCISYYIFKPQPSDGEKTFTLKITHGDNTDKLLYFTSNDTYLGDVLLKEGIIEGEKGTFGLYITKVDGEQAIYEKDKAYWALFINGEYATSGIDATPVNDGDDFWLVYTLG